MSDLPDCNMWPTWGALRERVLTSCREVRVVSSPSVRDAFAIELVKLSPPLLQRLVLRGSQHLHRFVMSPLSSCPRLEELDLSGCPTLEYVMIQSHTLRSIHLTNCGALTKALLHCSKLSQLSITNCSKLTDLLMWSDDLTELDLTGCGAISELKLHCPSLSESSLPTLPPPEVAQRIRHPPIATMLVENCKEAAIAAAEAKELDWKVLKDDSMIPAAHRPF